MTDLRIATPQPIYGANRPLTGPAGSGAVVRNAAMQSDSYDPIGGNGPEYQALLQQTDQLAASRDPQQLFQAIINMTRMQPADALPRLQRIMQTPGLDSRVYELAQRGAAAMQGMAQQPAAQQPAAQQPAAQQPAAQQPAAQQPAAQQPAAAIPAYQGAAVPANLNPNDAQMLIQNLRPDLERGGDLAINAIRQIMGMVQAQPAQKELAFSLLLNHLYSKRGPSTLEALKALNSMNDPRLAQYLPMVQRDASYLNETRALAVEVMKANAAKAAGPGVAQAGGGMTVEMMRALEYEMRVGGAQGAAILQQIRAGLGANPGQSPNKAEAMRIAITVVAKFNSPEMVVPAIRLLGEIRSRDMNCLDYLSSVLRSPTQSQEAKAAAQSAIQQIMASP